MHVFYAVSEHQMNLYRKIIRVSIRWFPKSENSALLYSHYYTASFILHSLYEVMNSYNSTEMFMIRKKQHFHNGCVPRNITYIIIYLLMK